MKQHHDNVRPHTLNATSAAIKQLKFEVIEHPIFARFGTFYFHLFSDLRKTSKRH